VIDDLPEMIGWMKGEGEAFSHPFLPLSSPYSHLRSFCIY